MNVGNIKIEGSQVTLVIPLNFKYALITSLVATIALVTYFLYPKADYTNEALFAEYFQKPKYEGRAGDTETGAIVKAMTLIETEHYTTAIEKLKEIENQGKYFAEAAEWYTTLCLLKTHADSKIITRNLCKIIVKQGKYSSLSLEILCKRHQYQQKKKPQILAP